MTPEKFKKKLPRYPIPVMLIAQLTVHRNAQGFGLGKITLIEAMQHCFQIHGHLPSCAIVVDAINDGVKAFYEQYGFQVLDDSNKRARLFISMKTVHQLFVS